MNGMAVVFVGRAMVCGWKRRTEARRSRIRRDILYQRDDTKRLSAVSSNVRLSLLTRRKRRRAMHQRRQPTRAACAAYGDLLLHCAKTGCLMPARIRQA